MENQKRAQKPTGHGVTGFELTAFVLQNLYNYELSTSAKLILLYLCSCHNGKKGYVFPKQKTIAQKLGISERSVIRGIQELVKEGLILVECNLSNKYFWGSKIASECPHFLSAENVSGDNDKMSLHNDKLAVAHVHEQANETVKEQNVKKEPEKVEDYKILKEYAIKNGAKNVGAYVNFLRKNGAAQDIITQHKLKDAADRFAANQIKRTEKMNAQYREWIADDPKECEAIQRFKEQHGLL